MTTDIDLDESEFDKIVGQYRLSLNKVLHPLRMYGQGAYVDLATAEVVNLSLQMHFKLSGVDMPYMVQDNHW